MLEQVELTGKERALVRTLSGGERQRLALALALLHDPELLILDEPTAALDPVARRGVHAIVERLAAAGKTVLLTTHYIEEAEKLCKRVILLRRGTVVADGSPFELIGRAAGRLDSLDRGRRAVRRPPARGRGRHRAGPRGPPPAVLGRPTRGR